MTCCVLGCLANFFTVSIYIRMNCVFSYIVIWLCMCHAMVSSLLSIARNVMCKTCVKQCMHSMLCIWCIMFHYRMYAHGRDEHII